MPEPTFSEVMEDLWSRLPAVHREEDAKQLIPAGGYPFKRWLSGMAARLQEVMDLVDRFEFIPIEEGGRGTSDLVDAQYADPAWFPWIAMIRGLTYDPSASIAQQRDLLSGTEGYNKGTKNSIAQVVAAALTGSKYVRVYDHSNDVAPIGQGAWTDILIVTKASETPINPVTLVTNAKVKPMGFKLYYKQVETPWSTIETEFPTWADWNAATWRDIEESGF